MLITKAHQMCQQKFGIFSLGYKTLRTKIVMAIPENLLKKTTESRLQTTRQKCGKMEIPAWGNIKHTTSKMFAKKRHKR